VGTESRVGDGIKVTQVGVQWRVLVNAVMTFGFHKQQRCL
jgi:hypothetical protein